MTNASLEAIAGNHGAWSNDMERIERTIQRSGRESLLATYAAGGREFRDWNLDGQNLRDCDLSGADFEGSSFVGADLTNANLRGGKFSRCDFTRATLSRAILLESDISWATMPDADLVGADLRRTHARAVNLTKALMIRARLNDADCLGAMMSGVNATAAQMESANLECVDMSGSALMNANLTGANCSWANLSDARLNWAQLCWCNLEAADLEQANLTGASMRGANMSFSNLDEAVLTGADFYFATLSGALLPNEMVSARLSSVRLTSQTYTRSNWSRELLREWQQHGAMILDFEALPRDVQSFLRKGECNLRIYFKGTISDDEQMALEALIAHLTRNAGDLRILSVFNDQGKSQIAFYCHEPGLIDLFVSTLREKTWNHDSDSLEKRFRESEASRHKDLDILARLDQLASEICHIQALVPVSKDDKTRQYQIRLDACESCENLNEKTQISWSSVSLPKVSR